MPNFFILGAPKAGTTALSAYLQQHPQIYMSPLKEPHFFTIENQNPDFRDAGDATRAVTQWSEYLKLFNGRRDEIAVGEASTTYLSSRKAAQGIHARLPDARLIAILRQPIERAYSAFVMYHRENREDKESLLAAIETEHLGKHYHGETGVYQARGFYFEPLSTYIQLFGKQNIKIYLYEDFVQQPQALLNDLHEFLEVDSFQADMSITHNVGGIHKSGVLKNLLTRPNPIRFFARKLMPSKLRISMREKIKGADLEKARPLDHATWEALLEVYREDIANLQTLIDRDLSHWLRPQPDR